MRVIKSSHFCFTTCSQINGSSSCLTSFATADENMSFGEVLNRVTRMGELSPFGRLFTFGQIF
jgi:hypothetical protein